MKGAQECYDLSMKSPARKGGKQVVTFTLRRKEAHSSLSVSSAKTFKGEEKHLGGGGGVGVGGHVHDVTDLIRFT